MEYKDEKVYNVMLSIAEKRFIERCRDIEFGEIGKVTIKNGQPVSAEFIMKSERFDIPKK